MVSHPIYSSLLLLIVFCALYNILIYSILTVLYNPLLHAVLLNLHRILCNLGPVAKCNWLAVLLACPRLPPASSKLDFPPGSDQLTFILQYPARRHPDAAQIQYSADCIPDKLTFITQACPGGTARTYCPACHHLDTDVQIPLKFI